MPHTQVIEIDARSPELGAASELFDRYRSFYGKPTNLGLAGHYLRERLAANESTVLLARLEDRWVGFCQVYRGFSSISCARTAILNDLYVDPDHRSVGVGRALIAHVIAMCRQAGVALVMLETAETNSRAQALYEELGFERSRGFVGYSLCLCPT
ncbi:MAG: GNAT family N-acetyltransferase [Burkholderiales bacterium]|nr:MAG: GNAT family N-acetyltransferase [Burkholderiales bacterium]